MTILDEDKVVKFDGKTFPKFGWCVILAGGAGSGKGYSLEHYVPIQGRKYDPDMLKKYNLKTWRIEKHDLEDDYLVLPDGEKYSLADVYDSRFNREDMYTMKNPKFTSLVHRIVNPQSKRFKNHIMDQIKAAPDGKLPNIIFDVTLSAVEDYEAIIPVVKSIGYKVVIVYVFTDFDRATVQNATRERRVSDEIMFKTHKGLFNAFSSIKNRPDIISQLDGVWVVMNDIKDRVKVFDIKDGDKINIRDERINDFIRDNTRLINRREFEYNDQQIAESLTYLENL